VGSSRSALRRCRMRAPGSAGEHAAGERAAGLWMCRQLHPLRTSPRARAGWARSTRRAIRRQAVASRESSTPRTAGDDAEDALGLHGRADDVEPATRARRGRGEHPNDMMVVDLPARWGQQAVDFAGAHLEGHARTFDLPKDLVRFVTCNHDGTCFIWQFGQVRGRATGQARHRRRQEHAIPRFRIIYEETTCSGVQPAACVVQGPTGDITVSNSEAAHRAGTTSRQRVPGSCTGSTAGIRVMILARTSKAGVAAVASFPRPRGREDLPVRGAGGSSGRGRAGATSNRAHEPRGWRPQTAARAGGAGLPRASRAARGAVAKETSRRSSVAAAAAGARTAMSLSKSRGHRRTKIRLQLSRGDPIVGDLKYRARGRRRRSNRAARGRRASAPGARRDHRAYRRRARDRAWLSFARNSPVLPKAPE